MKSVKELTDGAWRARWGRYFVFLVKRDEWWHGAIRDAAWFGGTRELDDHDPLMAVFSAVDLSRVVALVCLQMDRAGCYAMVDGRRHDLMKFLAFEPVDLAEVAFIP